jgi:hypothetical protein
MRAATVHGRPAAFTLHWHQRRVPTYFEDSRSTTTTAVSIPHHLPSLGPQQFFFCSTAVSRVDAFFALTADVQV